VRIMDRGAGGARWEGGVGGAKTKGSSQSEIHPTNDHRCGQSARSRTTRTGSVLETSNTSRQHKRNQQVRSTADPEGQVECHRATHQREAAAQNVRRAAPAMDGTCQTSCSSGSQTPCQSPGSRAEQRPWWQEQEGAGARVSAGGDGGGSGSELLYDTRRDPPGTAPLPTVQAIRSATAAVLRTCNNSLFGLVRRASEVLYRASRRN